MIRFYGDRSSLCRASLASHLILAREIYIRRNNKKPNWIEDPDALKCAVRYIVPCSLCADINS